MAIFRTNKESAERIEALEARVEELESDAEARDAEVQSLRAELAAANENLTAVTTERDQARADLAAANTTIAERDATIAAHPTEEQINARVEAAALAKFQSLGGNEPVEGGGENAGKSITRAEFNKLSHADRNAHMRSGGKVID